MRPTYKIYLVVAVVLAFTLAGVIAALMRDGFTLAESLTK
jgi:hypothetical protein